MPIEARELTHVYMPGTPFTALALDRISFTVEDGAFVGLIGHTGSGKSTLVQHMNGLMKPTSGELIVDGVSVGAKGADMRALRRRVGLVFQYPEYQLFEETVLKDVAFGPKNLGLSAAQAEIQAKEALRLVGLGDENLWAKSPFELSGGQKRRVAVAGVLSMQPKILILDEPAAGLDPAGRDEILQLIQKIHARGGVTTIMVSHSMSDVARLCDRLLVMNEGQLAYSGTPAQVFRHGEALRKMGLELPPCARLFELLREKGFGDLPEDVIDMDGAERALLRAFGREEGV